MDYDTLFKKTYKDYKNVPYQAAQASAAVMVWKDAFERANSFDVEKVRQALTETNMKTFYGSIKFSKAGNNIAKPMVLRQIQNGKFKIVAPLKWASAPVEHPRKVPGM
jgi:branched-chain amino acid transport system substrate-binding protein